MTDTWETSITTETWESNDTPGVVWTTVVSDGSGGGGGVTVHNLLTGRDATDSHPMGAITGLTAALAAKADTASLAAVATSGDYSDLSGTPSLGSAAAANTTDFAAAVHSHDITSLTTSGPDGKMPVTASGGIALVDVPSGGTSRIPNNSGRIYGPMHASASSASTLELNRLLMYPLDMSACAIDAMAVWMDGASTSGSQWLRLFICADINGLPADVLWQGVVTPVSTTLVITLLPSPIPVSGWIWMGCVAQGAPGYGASDFKVRLLNAIFPRTPGLPYTSPLGALRNAALATYTGVLPATLAGITFDASVSSSFTSMGVRIA